MNDKLQMKVIDYLQDTCAMERAVLGMLDSAISNTDDMQMKELLRNHREQTAHHGARLQRRLDELGQMRSATAEISAAVGSWFKGIGDSLRGDKAGKNARDAFVTEHVEIAAYELLERLAERAGDEKTAEVCRMNKADEYEMAKRLGGMWDRAVDLTLLEAGIDMGGRAKADSGSTSAAGAGTQAGRAHASERGSSWDSPSTEGSRGAAMPERAMRSDETRGNVS